MPAAAAAHQRPAGADDDAMLLAELEVAARYSATQWELKQCQSERDAYKREADDLRQQLLELQSCPARCGQDQKTDQQLREQIDCLQLEVSRLRVALGHRTDELEATKRLIAAGHAARDAAERDLMRALTYRTEELESARKELNEAQETANAAKVEITMLSAELGFARKGNDLMQGEVEYLKRQAQLESASRCSEIETSSLLSSSSTALPDVAIPPLISATSSAPSKPSGSYSSSPSSSAAAAGQPITEVSGVAARVEAGLKADGGNLQASTVAASGVFKNSRSFMC